MTIKLHAERSCSAVRCHIDDVMTPGPTAVLGRSFTQLGGRPSIQDAVCCVRDTSDCEHALCEGVLQSAGRQSRL